MEGVGGPKGQPSLLAVQWLGATPARPPLPNLALPQPPAPPRGGLPLRLKLGVLRAPPQAPAGSACGSDAPRGVCTGAATPDEQAWLNPDQQGAAWDALSARGHRPVLTPLPGSSGHPAALKTQKQGSVLLSHLDPRPGNPPRLPAAPLTCPGPGPGSVDLPCSQDVPISLRSTLPGP